METIKRRCFTNLDDWDTSKVTEFARVPNVGERVSAIYNGKESSLKVVQITHDFKDNKPFLRIELHK